MDNQQPPYQPSQPQPSTATPPATAAPTPEQSKQELREAILDSNQVLVSATTALTLFPDTMTIDRAKLTVTKRSFFSTAEVMSMRIEDILNVTAQVGPLFGSVKIVSRVMTNDRPYTVGNFWRGDALRLKRIAQGYVIAMQRQIDCSSLSTKELSSMLDQLGEDDHVGT